MAGFFLMLGEARGEVKPLDAAKNRPSSGTKAARKNNRSKASAAYRGCGIKQSTRG
jgi:hypothetical protein